MGIKWIYVTLGIVLLFVLGVIVGGLFIFDKESNISIAMHKIFNNNPEIEAQKLTITWDSNLSDSLVHYYSFDENQTTNFIMDALGTINGSGYGGFRLNSTETIRGNYSAEFGGSWGFVNLTQTFGGNSGTVVFWTYQHGSSQDKFIIGDRDASVGSEDYMFISTQGVNGYGGRIRTSGSDHNVFPNQPVSYYNWHMIAISWGAEGLSLYVDSQQNSTDAYTGAWNNIHDLYLGGSPGFSSNYYDGQIDEVMFFNIQLNQTQIDYLWNDSSGAFPVFSYDGGEPSPVGNASNISMRLEYPKGQQFNTTTISLSATALLGNATLENVTFYVWNSTGNLTTYINDSVSAITDINLNYTITLVNDTYSWNAFGCGSNVSTSFCNFNETNQTFQIGYTESTPSTDWALEEGLVLYYNMSNSGDEQVSHVSNITSDQGTPVYETTGAFLGYGLNVTVDNNAQILDSNIVLEFRYNTTMNAWLKIRGDASGTVMLFNKYGGGGTGWFVEQLRGGTNEFDFPYICASGSLNFAQGYINDDEWHMFTMMRNDTAFSTYVNGTYVSSCPATLRTDTTEDLHFGVGQAGGNDMPIMFDEVGFWNRSLTASEISDLWNNSNGNPRAQGTAEPPAPTGQSSNISMRLEYPKGQQFNTTTISLSATALLGNATLENVTFYVWNSTGNLTTYINDSVSAITDINLNYTITLVNDTYSWNAFGCGSNVSTSFCNFNETNQTFQIGYDYVPPVSSPVYTDYLFAYFPFDEGSGNVTSDTVRNFTFDGYNTTAETWANGLNGSSLNSTAKNYEDQLYFQMDNNTFNQGLAYDSSMSVWVRPNNITYKSFLMSSFSSVGLEFFLDGDIDMYGNPYPATGGPVSHITVGTSDGSLEKLTSENPLVLNDWVHILWTTNSSGTTLYVNGTFTYDATRGQSTTPLLMPDWVFRLYAHTSSELTPDAQYFGNWQIDELKIYNYSLNSSDVVTEYNLLSAEAYAQNEDLNPESTITTSLLQNGTTDTDGNVTLSILATPYNATVTNATFYLYNSDGSLNNTLTNTSISSITAININRSFLNLNTGTYFWNAQSCGNNATTSFCHRGTANFTLIVDITEADTIDPNVTIVSPPNNTYYNTSNIIYVNYTINDTNLNSCWYSVDLGVTNTSLSCGSNISDTVLFGNRTIFVYANDTSGNIGFDLININMGFNASSYPTSFFEIYDEIAEKSYVAGNWSNSAFLSDGNWILGTYVIPNNPENTATFNPNYTILSDYNIDFAKWRIKDSFKGDRNITIASECIENRQNLSLSIYGRARSSLYSYLYYYCYGESSWITLDTSLAIGSSPNQFYEEAVIWHWAMNDTAVSYNDPAYEGSNESFIVNLTYDASIYSNVEANFYYNGTFYESVEYTSNQNNISFISNAITPYIDSQVNNSFYWQIVLNNGSQDFYFNTSEYTQTVDNFFIDDCSVYDTEILRFNLKDEEDNTFINTTAEATNIEVDLILSHNGGQWNYSNQWTNENNVSICMPSAQVNASNYTLDMVVGFSVDNHVYEFFYVDNGTLDANSNAINSLTNKTTNLMSLLTTDSTSFLFNYFDADGLTVEDAIVHVFRKYIGEGLFREVERAKQNDDGDTVIHLVEEDVIYYFVVSQYGDILYTSNSYTALCQDTPCLIQLEEAGGFQEFPNDWDLIDNGGYTISASSLTRQVNMTYSLTSSSTMNLTVYELDSDGEYSVIGSNQSTGTYKSLFVYVPQASGNISFFATVRKDGTFIRSQWIDFEEDAGLYFGNALSLFLGALLILTLGLVAVTEGAVTIIFLIVGMLIASFLGLVDYRTSTGISLLIYLVVSGGIILWKLTRRNR